jgi:DNA-binding CsgD family transcriptional regulator
VQTLDDFDFENERDKKIVKMYLSGMYVYQILEKDWINSHLLYVTIDKYGIERRKETNKYYYKNRLTNAEIDEIVKKIKKGVSNKEIEDDGISGGLLLQIKDEYDLYGYPEKIRQQKILEMNIKGDLNAQEAAHSLGVHPATVTNYRKKIFGEYPELKPMTIKEKTFELNIKGDLNIEETAAKIGVHVITVYNYRSEIFEEYPELKPMTKKEKKQKTIKLNIKGDLNVEETAAKIGVNVNTVYGYRSEIFEEYPELKPMTKKEKKQKIIELNIKGDLTTKEIASEIGVNVNTVYGYRSEIFEEYPELKGEC